MSTVTIPAQDVVAVDQMDDAIAMLKVVHTAITETDLVNVVYVEECASVLWQAIQKLSPVREMVNDMGAA